MTKKKAVRPRTFFDVTVDGAALGRVVFELFSDLTPITCENFRALCVGDKGKGPNTGKNLHYKGSTFHRVVKNFMVQGGDFEFGNGTGGESIYGGTFADECFERKHDEPFLLSMANRGKDTNGSQFFILTHKAPHLDGVHVVFGKVVSGQNVVAEIEALKVNPKNSRPEADVVINHCGELMLKKKRKKRRHKGSESDDSSSSSSEDEDEKEAEKEEAKEAAKEKSEEPEEIKPEEAENIPEVPGNRFLLRRSQTPEELRQKRAEEEGKDAPEPKKEKKREPPARSRVFVSKSGHKIRGRGAIRFRTPSPGGRDRGRSVTPPHWRQASQGRRSIADVGSGRMRSDDAQEEPPKPRHDDDQRRPDERRDRRRQDRSPANDKDGKEKDREQKDKDHKDKDKDQKDKDKERESRRHKSSRKSSRERDSRRRRRSRSSSASRKEKKRRFREDKDERRKRKDDKEGEVIKAADAPAPKDDPHTDPPADQTIDQPSQDVDEAKDANEPEDVAVIEGEIDIPEIEIS